MSTRIGKSYTLIKASEDNKFELVKHLIKEGVAINTKDEDGNTALHKAAIGGHHGIAKLLLENGAHVDCRTYNGFSPLDFAVMKGNYPFVMLLLQENAEVNPLPDLCQCDSTLPLNHAAESGHLEMVKLLIKNGANPKAKDAKDETALHYAVRCHSKYAAEICGLLLKNGVDVDAKARFSGDTALHKAVEDVDRYNEEVIQTILNFGPKTGLRNAFDTLTPLESAVFYANHKAVGILVENGIHSEKPRRKEPVNANFNPLEIGLHFYNCRKKGNQIVKTMLYAKNKN